MNLNQIRWLSLFAAIVIASNSPDDVNESVPIKGGGPKRGYNETSDGEKVPITKIHSSIGIKKPRTDLFTFEDALRHSFIRAVKLDVHEFVNFLAENCGKKTQKVLIFPGQHRTTDNYSCF